MEFPGALRLFTSLAARTKLALQFGSEVGITGRDMDWLSGFLSHPVIQFLRVVLTNRPCRRTGIPSDAHLCTTEVGSPRKAAICCQPLSSSGVVLTFDSVAFDLHAISSPVLLWMHPDGTKSMQEPPASRYNGISAFALSVRKWRNWQTHQT
jgi:hypothetical protein